MMALQMNNKSKNLKDFQKDIMINQIKIIVNLEIYYGKLWTMTILKSQKMGWMKCYHTVKITNN